MSFTLTGHIFTLTGYFTLTPSIYLSQHPHPHPNVFLLRQGKCSLSFAVITIWVLYLITIWAGWNYYNSRQFLLQLTAEFGGITIQGSFYCNSGQILQFGSIITIQSSTRPHFNEPNMLIKILARPLIDQNMY